MATWDELDNEEEADKNKEEVDLALVASRFLYSESEVDFDSDSENANEVFSKLIRSDLILLSKSYGQMSAEIQTYENIETKM